MTEIIKQDTLSGFWGTADEKAFIDGLGKSSYKVRNDPSLADIKEYDDRKSMLEGYLMGASQRDRWGAINKKSVIRYALNALKNVNGDRHEQ